MKKFILIFLLIFLGNSAIYAQEKVALVEDNFSGNSYKWWTGRSAVAKCEISHGEYILSYRGQKSWSSNIEVNIDQRGDFIIESKISRMNGTEENGYGVAWGKGRRGYYTFIITPKGKFYVRKVEKGRAGVYLVDWQETPHINKTSATNKLRIQKKGDEVQFFINNKFVAKIPSSAIFWQAGRIYALPGATNSSRLFGGLRWRKG
jgi:hypothetical protein